MRPAGRIYDCGHRDTTEDLSILLLRCVEQHFKSWMAPLQTNKDMWGGGIRKGDVREIHTYRV